MPAISEFEDDDKHMIEKLSREIDLADDFSLYIENEEGVRMKRIGNKLIKYDDYVALKANDNKKVGETPTIELSKHPSSAERKKKLHEVQKATWSFFGRLPPVKQKGSYSNSATGEVETEAPNNVRSWALNRLSVVSNPIEQLSGSNSAETLLVRLSNKENTVDTDAITTTFATTTLTTPKGSKQSGTQRSLDNCGNTGELYIPHVYRHPLQDLSLSPFSDIRNVEDPERSSTPITKCHPQAQSTPFDNRESRRTLSSNRDSFDNASSCSLPKIPGASKEVEEELMHKDDPMCDPEDSILLSSFNRSLHLSTPFSDNNDSCGTLATLAEEAPLQCTNAGRNAGCMTINTTAYSRNISYLRNTSLVNIPYYLCGYSNLESGTPLSQLLYVIEQTEVIEWKHLPRDVFANPRKLGEGVYGEVFATTYDGIATALKVIPFQGDTIVYKEKVNGEYLLDAANILPEILINRELSALFDPKAEFSTPNFIQLLKTNVVKGLYPQQFLTAWDAFDEANGSENDRPTNYASEQQLFVTMGMAMGGVDLEHYQMKDEDQVMSVLLQIAISLVVAEERLEFEHRDLHVGNALVLESSDDLEYRFAGGDMILRSQGVKVHLIDFTLSRMSKEGTTIFRDLENDEELFAGDSDYQFDIYRMMRKSNQGDWLAFNPKSNCFWMHYLAMELINKRRCKKAITRKRRRDLQKIWDHLLEFDCLRELFTHDEFYDVLQRHMVVKPPTGRWRQ